MNLTKMVKWNERQPPTDGLVLHPLLDAVRHAAGLLGVPCADDANSTAGSAVTRLRSSLAAHAASMREPDPDAGRRLAARGWQDTGFVAIDPAWLTSWVDRQQLIILAERVHGERKPSG